MLSLTHTHLDQRSWYSAGRAKRLSTRTQHGGSHRSYHRSIRSQSLHKHGSSWPIHRLQIRIQPVVASRATVSLKVKRLEYLLNLIAWLRHYLTGRWAFIEIKESRSAQFSLLRGVPHGSCVGPVLFILYHYDMLDSITSVHWKHLFADDLSVVFAPSPTLAAANMMLTLADQIKEVLKQLLWYSIKWKQEINFRKTFWILFHRQVAPRIPDISVEGRQIGHGNKIQIFGHLSRCRIIVHPPYQLNTNEN